MANRNSRTSKSALPENGIDRRPRRINPLLTYHLDGNLDVYETAHAAANVVAFLSDFDLREAHSEPLRQVEDGRILVQTTVHVALLEIMAATDPSRGHNG